MTRRSVVVGTFGLAGVLLLGGGIGVVRASDPAPTGVTGNSPERPAPTAAVDPLAAEVATLQERLRRTPQDGAAWAALGSAYLQQGRVTADPSFYPKAEAALARSLRLASRNNDAALTGMATLAAARHDFAAALSWARRASRANPYHANAYGVAGDALVELGRYPEAFAAFQRMADLKPGLSSFARASYAWELRGNTGQARAALERALQDARTPADTAFVLYYLGELAWNSGDVAAAAEQYDAGLAADPSYQALRQGRAKVALARGRTDDAIRDYTAVVARAPQPQYVMELGDLYTFLGRRADATRAYDLVRAEQALLTANGVNADLELALFNADHGNAAAAIVAARAEWRKRHSIFVADALGWALHKAGRHAEALRYARHATSLGMRNAQFYFHRGLIEKALGQRAAARSNLKRALAINPHFGVLQAPIARRALAELSTAR